MKIAIVGSGITGLGSAWLLSKHHDVTLFEADDRIGGHAHTVEVETPGGPVAVDTGFIVYNTRNYPHLTRLFAQIGAPTKDSDMSFAVSLDDGDLEYAGSAKGIFAQRSNLVRPRYWRMIGDILRFYREAPALLSLGPDAVEMSLESYLRRERYSRSFVDDHLLPMAAAIWSCPVDRILSFPAVSFVRFLDNHGLLLLRGRPRWRTVDGGSREYVKRLTAPFADRIRTNCPVTAARRTPAGVELTLGDGSRERFDQLVLATHGDQALAILGADADHHERRILGAFRYEKNDAVLHSDPRLMPQRRRVWASWNYIASRGSADSTRLSVTYWMNKLQGLERSPPLFVTLNPLVAPEESLVHRRLSYDHPVFDAAAVEAQAELPAIQGQRRTWFCGSYCGYGFHEDGLEAGFAVARALGCPAPWDDAVRGASPSESAVSPFTPSQAAE